MKVALLLRGITYKERYIHHTGRILKIDYRVNLDKIKEQIIEPLKSKYDVDVFLVTYKNSLEEEDIIKDFDCVGADFLPQEGQTQTDNLLAGLRLIYRKGEDRYNPVKYDFIVITRFDIDLLMNIDDINYNEDKFNFIWSEQTCDGQVGDCMFFLNGEFLLAFINAVNMYSKTSYIRSLHFIKPYIERYIDKQNINIIFDGFWDSNTDYRENPLYKIIRQDGPPIIYETQPSFYNKFLKNARKFGIRR